MEDFKKKILDDERVFKPGYTRINIHYFISKKEINYILDAIEFISKYGWLLLPHYKFEKYEGIWTNSDEAPFHHRLGNLFLNGEDLVFSSSIETLINLDKESKPWKI